MEPAEWKIKGARLETSNFVICRCQHWTANVNEHSSKMVFRLSSRPLRESVWLKWRKEGNNSSDEGNRRKDLPLVMDVCMWMRNDQKFPAYQHSLSPVCVCVFCFILSAFFTSTERVSVSAGDRRAFSLTWWNGDTDQWAKRIKNGKATSFPSTLGAVRWIALNSPVPCEWQVKKWTGKSPPSCFD